MTSLNFSLRPPQHVKIGGTHRIEFLSGCAVQEVCFPSSTYVKIGEINFKNYHVAWLTMQVKTRSPVKNNGPIWKTCVKKFEMMPDVHDGKTAENYFTISAKHMLFEPANVMSIRFILRQPSPLWQEIRIENITIYSPENEDEIALPAWLTQPQPPVTATSVLNKQINGVGLMSDVCSQMQKLWSLTHESAPNMTHGDLGRYDVEGNYDINLLSYT